MPVPVTRGSPQAPRRHHAVVGKCCRPARALPIVHLLKNSFRRGNRVGI